MDRLAVLPGKSPVLPIREAALFLKRLGAQYNIVFATGSLRKSALLKLQQAGIAYCEAHNYLRYMRRMIDCTFPKDGIPDFEVDLLEETEIIPEQIGGV